MKQTPFKPFKRKEGVIYYPNSTIRVKMDKVLSSPLKRSKLRVISKKQTKIIKDYTKTAIEKSIRIFGYDRCFVCSATEDLITHHFDKNRKNNESDNVFRLCRKHHDHMGSENLERVNQRIIEKKLKIKGRI